MLQIAVGRTKFISVVKAGRRFINTSQFGVVIDVVKKKKSQIKEWGDEALKKWHLRKYLKDLRVICGRAGN